MLGTEGRRAALREVGRAPLSMFAAGAACTLSFALLLVALSQGGAGAVMTLRNTSVVFPLGLSVLLGERPGPRQLAGSALVVAGAVELGWPG